VTAAGADPARLECIPCRAAAFEKVLRVITGAAIPAARCVWTPFAERAANAAELLSFVAFRVLLSNFRRLQSLLEKPECCREMQKLEHTFLLRNHFLTRLRDALRQVLEKKLFNPGSVVGSELAVGELFVEPEFSLGIFFQSLLQEPRVGKGYDGISRRMN
jgi:hypothetical protein